MKSLLTVLITICSLGIYDTYNSINIANLSFKSLHHSPAFFESADEAHANILLKKYNASILFLDYSKPTNTILPDDLTTVIAKTKTGDNIIIDLQIESETNIKELDIFYEKEGEQWEELDLLEGYSLNAES